MHGQHEPTRLAQVATDAQVLAAITAVNALVGQGFNEQSMYLLIDRAIADAMINNSGVVRLPFASTTSNGVVYEQMPVAQAIQLRDYYRMEWRKINPAGALMPEYIGPFPGDGQDGSLASY